MGRIIGGIALIALMVAGCSGGGQPAPATSTTTTTTTSQADAATDYAQDTLAPLLDRLGSAFVWIGGAMQSMDLADTRAGCRELASVVDDLEAALPTPVSAATYQLEEAAASMRAISRECQGISPSTSSAEFDEMTRNRLAAERSLKRAVDALRSAAQG